MFSSGFVGFSGASGASEPVVDPILAFVQAAQGAAPPGIMSSARLTEAQQGMMYGSSTDGQRAFPPAPACPLLPEAVAETSRGAKPPAAITPTVGSYMANGTIPAGFAELLDACGASDSVGLDLFCAIPEAELMDNMADLTLDGNHVVFHPEGRTGPLCSGPLCFVWV